MHEAPLNFVAQAPLTRRKAMAWMAASIALANGACTEQPRELIHPWVNMPEASGAGLSAYYASAFLCEGHAMGVLIGTHDGRPIKIEGNPLHPSSLGGCDAAMQASVLDLWDPDRSKAVMQSLGGSGPGAVSSWSAFEAAWLARERVLHEHGGEGLALLTGPLSSPTARAQIDALLQRMPRARWYQHAPLHDHAAEAGAIAAFGRPVQPLLHLDRASCIVALGSDPFTDGAGALRHAADWASARATKTHARMLAAEVTPGLFGARADQRIALAPAHVDALVQRLAAVLLDGQHIDASAFEAQVLDALRRAGPASLLVPGACLSPASHALVHAIHDRLQARTLDLIEPVAMHAAAGSLSELTHAMGDGAVDTLLVLDANPAYDASAALGFNDALRHVPFSVHAGLHRDETALACTWHLPLSHAYEQWSDARAHDGSVTLMQPAILPLYDTRSLHELLALLSGTERDAHRLLQQRWGDERAQANSMWRESLRRGVVEGTASAPLSLPAPMRPPAATPAADALCAVFVADPFVRDGRQANNAWLQELPRPITRHAWGNALLIGPRTAQAMSLQSGDVVHARIEGRSLDAPVMVLDAHAEGAVSLPLGHGRRVGRVAQGVGFDAYALRPASDAPPRIELQRTGRRQALAIAQEDFDMHGREPARVLRGGEHIAHDGLAQPSLYPPKQRGAAQAAHAWAMSIDLDACIGCGTCTIACQAENNIPVVGAEQTMRGRAMHWMRIDRYELAQPAGGSIFQPVACQHCENAPCELVCPVGATVHDSEGLNVQVYNRCIGTRFCSNNCPYKVRRFNFLAYNDVQTETLKAQRNPEVTVRSRGVMEKCSYCVQRIARARQHSERTGVPLKDGDVVTACQAACPTHAIRFGDLSDAASDIARARASPRHYALLGELNTRPRTTYLARVRDEGES